MNLYVLVYRRPNMFVVNDNLYNMIGYGELENLYTIENYRNVGANLQLYYPERFLNILEIRCLIERIENAGYNTVHITTNSEHLLTTVKSENIRIVCDEQISEGNFKLSNEESGMPYDGGLGVIGY